MKIVNIKTVNMVLCLVFKHQDYLKLTYNVSEKSLIRYYFVLDGIYANMSIASERYHFNEYDERRYLNECH